MNEEQMRKEFEEWFCNEYLHGGGIPNYGCSTTNIAWKASREEMKPIISPKYYGQTIEKLLWEKAIKEAGYEIEE